MLQSIYFRFPFFFFASGHGKPRTFKTSCGKSLSYCMKKMDNVFFESWNLHIFNNYYRLPGRYGKLNKHFPLHLRWKCRLEFLMIWLMSCHQPNVRFSSCHLFSCPYSQSNLCCYVFSLLFQPLSTTTILDLSIQMSQLILSIQHSIDHYSNQSNKSRKLP